MCTVHSPVSGWQFCPRCLHATDSLASIYGNVPLLAVRLRPCPPLQWPRPGPLRSSLSTPCPQHGRRDLPPADAEGVQRAAGGARALAVPVMFIGMLQNLIAGDDPSFHFIQEEPSGQTRRWLLLLKAPLEEILEDDEAQDHLHRRGVPSMPGRESIASCQICSNLFEQFVVVQ